MAKRMARMAARQLIRMLRLIFCASLAAFVLLSLSPIDPLQQNVGQAAMGSMSAEQIQRLQAYWGVDTPPLERFAAWVQGMLRGDFGVSLLYRQPVLTVIGAKLANSLWLLVLAWVISGLLGFGLGVLAGAMQGRWPDKLIRGWSMLIASTPAFWVALLLLMIFGVWLKLLPVGLSVPIGLEATAVTLVDRLRHAILPALALSITGTASVCLHTRQKTIQALESDFVLFARARGGAKGILLRHVLRHVLLPAITLRLPAWVSCWAAPVLVEQVFFLSGSRSGHGDSGPGRRSAAASGYHGDLQRHGIRCEFCGGLPVWSGGPPHPKGGRPGMKRIWNNLRQPRTAALIRLVFAAVILLAVMIAGVACREQALATDFTRKNLAPCAEYLFGTDWMGRDMFTRTLSGLSLSIRIGVVTAAVSAVVALAAGVSAALLGRWADSALTWLIDLFMGIPHILLLVLISCACGRGFWGVTIGIVATHWMSLARLIRGEVMQLRQSGYVQVARKLGASPAAIAARHILPGVLPQFFTGLVLLFPHAILHEASVTFLGFGLTSEQPAVGVILSESMQYLATGRWWLALLPGLCLVAVVLLFELAGKSLAALWSVNAEQEAA